jgi:hypothetical protein
MDYYLKDVVRTLYITIHRKELTKSKKGLMKDHKGLTKDPSHLPAERG